MEFYQAQNLSQLLRKVASIPGKALEPGRRLTASKSLYFLHKKGYIQMTIGERLFPVKTPIYTNSEMWNPKIIFPEAHFLFIPKWA